MESVRIENPLNEQSKIFCCKQCRTHIALITQLDDSLLGTKWVQFKDFEACRVNVYLEEDYIISNCLSTLRSVYCKTCDADLGFKLLYLFDEDKDVPAGSYLISKKKLMIWYKGLALDVSTVDPKPGC